MSDVSAIPSPSTTSETVDERSFQATDDVMPPVVFDERGRDSQDQQPLTTWLQSPSTQTYMDVETRVQAGEL